MILHFLHSLGSLAPIAGAVKGIIDLLRPARLPAALVASFRTPPTTGAAALITRSSHRALQKSASTATGVYSTVRDVICAVSHAFLKHYAVTLDFEKMQLLAWKTTAVRPAFSCKC